MDSTKNFRKKYGLISKNYDSIPISKCFTEDNVLDVLKQKDIYFLGELLLLSDKDFVNQKGTLIILRDYFSDLCRTEMNKSLDILFNVDINQISDIRIEDTDLTNRSKNGLMRNGARTARDMLQITKKQLFSTRNLGVKCIREILSLIENLPINETVSNQIVAASEEEIIGIYIEALGRLSDNRKRAKVEYYKKYYIKTRNDRIIENNYYGNTTLEELINNLITNKNEIYKYQDFILWCSQDVAYEIQKVINAVIPNEREKNVIFLRSNSKTLEEIGTEYGITRERIRQIEAKALRKLAPCLDTEKLLFLIGIECNEHQVIDVKQILGFLKDIPEYANIFILISKINKDGFYYNGAFNCFEFKDFNFNEKSIELINELPKQFHNSELENYRNLAFEKYGIESNAFNIIIQKEYNKTNDLFHKGQISVRKVIVPVLEKYYQDGIRVYDQNELSIFRALVEKEIGPGLLPENDRSLTAAIERVCVLCDRGKYRLQTDEYVSDDLKNKIWKYIKNHDCPIIMTESILNIFRKELNEFGIDNYNHLQGILHQLYGDKLIYKKSYISKDRKHKSLTKDIYDFIKNSKYPIDKKEIKERYPFVTEIVIATAVTVPSVLNYQGKYMHVANIKLSRADIVYFENKINKHLEQNDYVNCRTIYDEVEKENNELLLKCCVFYQSALFSVLEYFLSNKYQFSRPYIAKDGVEVGHPYERIAEMVNEYERIEISKVFEFIKNNRIVNPQIECINATNETHLIADEKWLVSINELGITEEIARDMENVILKYIDDTCPIYALQCFYEFPKINGKWTDWLVYSTLNRWGKNVDVAITPTPFKHSYPLIAAKGKMDSEKYRQVPKDVTLASMKYNDIDDMFIESIEEEWMENDEF